MLMTTLASEAIPFKQPFTPSHGLLNIGLAVVGLLVLALILAKRFQTKPSRQSPCRLIDKQFLGNKTIVYILEYQQQRFLLADNQHALAIHTLSSEAPHESA